MRSRKEGFMRRLIGCFVGLFYVCTGIRAWRVHKCRKPGVILAICGHDPTPRVLDVLLRWLAKRGFSFTDPDELIAMKEGRVPLRGSVVWLSFDDGWSGFADKVLPILERYNAKATIFVPPHESERGYLWTHAVKSVGGQAKVLEFYKKGLKEREDGIAGLSYGKTHVRSLMEKDELIALSQNPLVTIENHTWSHLSCYHRPTEDVIAEAKKAQEELKSWTGRTPRFLCYPFGHYGKGCDEALREIGLIGVHSDSGIGSIAEIGLYRNMFRDDMSEVETIGRALDAWPSQHIPDAQ